MKEKLKCQKKGRNHAMGSTILGQSFGIFCLVISEKQQSRMYLKPNWKILYGKISHQSDQAGMFPWPDATGCAPRRRLALRRRPRQQKFERRGLAYPPSSALSVVCCVQPAFFLLIAFHLLNSILPPDGCIEISSSSSITSLVSFKVRSYDILEFWVYGCHNQ